MKLIIEVSESYINERTNEEYLIQTMEKSGADALSALANMIAFKHLAEEMKNNKTEFVIDSSSVILDNDKRKLLDRTAEMFATTYLVMSKKN